MIRPPPRSTLFPYPPLSRSAWPTPSSRYTLLFRLRTRRGVIDTGSACGYNSHQARTAGWVLRFDRRSPAARSEEHTSELQSQSNLVCRLLLEKKKKTHNMRHYVTYPTNYLNFSTYTATILLQTNFASITPIHDAVTAKPHLEQTLHPTAHSQT